MLTILMVIKHQILEIVNNINGDYPLIIATFVEKVNKLPNELNIN